MTSQDKANWIRRIFTLFLVLIAAGAGLYFAMADGFGKDEVKEKTGLMVTRKNMGEILASPNKLTVINMMVDGSRESERLEEILTKLDKEKYDERVLMAGLDVEAEPEFAERHGVKKEGFAGHLDFYANGKKLEQLVGQTDPVVVEKTIDRLLAGLVQRISKNWLPEVPGMQRIEGQGKETLKIHPAEPAKPSPKP
ncbi:MAG: hypothetical protein EOP83_21000 [Verrucomicrobiaceae bacterium]|nr:MAG: hypothetical protein EOP83_21000 [Verrucomicrobiaceae bacterium]